MQTSFNQRVENSKTVDFGDILSKSFELFKKTWVEALIHALVTFLVVIPFLLVVYVPMLGFGGMLSNMGDSFTASSMMENIGGLMFFTWIGLIFFLSFLIQPFILSITGNFLRICKNKDLHQEVVPDGYFGLLKKHYGKMFLLSLATMGIAILAALLCYLPIFYVMVPLQLFLPVLVFNESLTVSEIIKASFKLGNKYWLMLFGLIIVSSLLASLGILLCGIGIIVTSYYQYIVLYYFYKDSVGFDD
jgi:hypothetical protein